MTIGKLRTPDGERQAPLRRYANDLENGPAKALLSARRRHRVEGRGARDKVCSSARHERMQHLERQSVRRRTEAAVIRQYAAKPIASCAPLNGAARLV
jgi:hypothetical protein